MDNECVIVQVSMERNVSVRLLLLVIYVLNLK